MSELENCREEERYETYWIDDESPIKNDILRKEYRIRKTENEKDDIIKKVDEMDA